ncbi:hypothetical protein KM043_002615 [Ampulex compressa]|nr:hypothetical protein KM043_002615 [Ampulex compressa]
MASSRGSVVHSHGQLYRPFRFSELSSKNDDSISLSSVSDRDYASNEAIQGHSSQIRYLADTRVVEHECLDKRNEWTKGWTDKGEDEWKDCSSSNQTITEGCGTRDIGNVRRRGERRREADKGGRNFHGDLSAPTLSSLDFACIVAQTPGLRRNKRASPEKRSMREECPPRVFAFREEKSFDRPTTLSTGARGVLFSKENNATAFGRGASRGKEYLGAFEFQGGKRRIASLSCTELPENLAKLEKTTGQLERHVELRLTSDATANG